MKGRASLFGGALFLALASPVQAQPDMYPSVTVDAGVEAFDACLAHTQAGSQSAPAGWEPDTGLARPDMVPYRRRSDDALLVVLPNGNPLGGGACWVLGALEGSHADLIHAIDGRLGTQSTTGATDAEWLTDGKIVVLNWMASDAERELFRIEIMQNPEAL